MSDVWTARIVTRPARHFLFFNGWEYDVKWDLNGRPDPMVSEKGYVGWCRSREKAIARARKYAAKDRAWRDARVWIESIG